MPLTINAGSGPDTVTLGADGDFTNSLNIGAARALGHGDDDAPQNLSSVGASLTINAGGIRRMNNNITTSAMPDLQRSGDARRES